MMGQAVGIVAGVVVDDLVATDEATEAMAGQRVVGTAVDVVVEVAGLVVAVIAEAVEPAAGRQTVGVTQTVPGVQTVGLTQAVGVTQTVRGVQGVGIGQAVGARHLVGVLGTEAEKAMGAATVAVLDAMDVAAADRVAATVEGVVVGTGTGTARPHNAHGVVVGGGQAGGATGQGVGAVAGDAMGVVGHAVGGQRGAPAGKTVLVGGERGAQEAGPVAGTGVVAGPEVVGRLGSAARVAGPATEMQVVENRGEYVVGGGFRPVAKVVAGAVAAGGGHPQGMVGLAGIGGMARVGGMTGVHGVTGVDAVGGVAAQVVGLGLGALAEAVVRCVARSRHIPMVLLSARPVQRLNGGYAPGGSRSGQQSRSSRRIFPDLPQRVTQSGP
jgi:hypothetical protein